MPFGQHNNGQFQKHASGVPYIKNYDDVFSFLVESPEDCKTKDAIALRLFDISFGKIIKDEEIRNEHRLSYDEITNLIERRVGAGPSQMLPTVLGEARQRATDLEHINEEAVKRVIESSSHGFWRVVRDGLIGSFATLIVVMIIFAIPAAVRAYMGHNLWAEALNFFHLNTDLPDAKLDSVKAGIDSLQQQVTELRKSPQSASAPPPDAKIDNLKTAVDDLRQQVIDLKKQLVTTPPSSPQPQPQPRPPPPHLKPARP